MTRNTSNSAKATNGDTSSSKADEHHDTADAPHQFQAGSTSHREVDAWKHRAPYKSQESNKDFKPHWHGKCHCGKVQYQLSRKAPLAAKYCHCTTCQRLHGAPFQWAAIFHKEDISFTHGHHDLGWYDPTAKAVDHHLPCKVSCAYCRSPIMDEGRNMILLFPGLIEEIMSDEGRKAFKAQSHMFYNERTVDFHGDGVTKFVGLDGKSDILDDGGEVVDRWMEKEEKFESEMKNGKRKSEDQDEEGGKPKKK